MKLTWVWRLFPVTISILVMVLWLSDNEARSELFIFVPLALFPFLFTDAKHFLSLHTVFLTEEYVIIKKSLSFKPEVKIPHRNAVKIDFIPLAQQILGRFWYKDPITNKKNYIYYWPTRPEAKWESSTLHKVCFKADLEIENNA